MWWMLIRRRKGHEKTTMHSSVECGNPLIDVAVVILLLKRAFELLDSCSSNESAMCQKKEHDMQVLFCIIFQNVCKISLKEAAGVSKPLSNLNPHWRRPKKWAKRTNFATSCERWRFPNLQIRARKSLLGLPQVHGRPGGGGSRLRL